MRYINEHNYNRLTFFLVLIYGLFLNWSPFINSFMVYAMSGFLILRGLLIRPHRLQFLTEIDFYLFSSPVFFYFIGLFYADNPRWRELSVVLPLLAFAAAFTSNKKLTKFELRRVLLIYGVSTTLCALVNFFTFVFAKDPNMDIREMSLFMSHIRFSLFVNIAIFSNIYYLFFCKQESLKRFETIIFWSVLSVLIPYLFIQQSLSGIVTFSAVVIFITIKTAFNRDNNKRTRIMFRMVISIIGLVLCSFIYEAQFFIFPKDSIERLPEFTANGNIYFHSYINSPLENGHYVSLNISDVELNQQWSKRSNVPIDGFDSKQQLVRYTLIRYLTSKNLTKDSLGISQLSPEDIQWIEHGETNYRFTNELLPNKKIYTFLWEIHTSFIGLDPTGHSAVQRLTFINAGFKLVEDYPWFGVGTSMPKEVLRPYYESMSPTLPQKMWYGPHNQFMSFTVMFGLVGLSIILLSYVILIHRTRAFRSYFKGMFFIILALSMLVEDSISTQAGVVLYGFFGGLFLFGTEDDYLF